MPYSYKGNEKEARLGLHKKNNSTCLRDIFHAGPSRERSTSTFTPAALRPRVISRDLIKYLLYKIIHYPFPLWNPLI